MLISRCRADDRASSNPVSSVDLVPARAEAPALLAAFGLGEAGSAPEDVRSWLSGATDEVPALVAGASLEGQLARRIARARGRTVQQGAVALSGIPLGLIAYLIAKPEPLATGSDGMNYVLGPLILLVFSGLTEELLFRGALTVSLGRIMGPATALASSA